MKKCFKCGNKKPIGDFYKHSGMSDGHLGKCKTCTKKDTSKNRSDKSDYYKEYDKKRNQRDDRKKQKERYQDNHRKNYPEKYKARNAVSNALRDGRLMRLPCIICGNEDSEAHHRDYSKYLDVDWLCFGHHRQEHGQSVI